MIEKSLKGVNLLKQAYIVVPLHLAKLISTDFILNHLN